MNDPSNQAIEAVETEIETTEKGQNVNPGISASFSNLINLIGFANWYQDEKPLTFSEAARLSAVMVCVDIIAQDISKAPLRLYERLPNDEQRVVEPGEHWLAAMLLDEPNDYHTWTEFLEMTISHLVLTQNAFIAKRIRIDGQTEQLIPVMPGRARILVDEEIAEYVFEVKRLTPHERVMLKGFPEVIPAERMIHIRGRMIDGLVGYSNLEAGAKTMTLAKELIDFQSRLFKHDGQTKGVFELDEVLSPEAYERLVETLAAQKNAMNRTGRPIVLEGGAKYKAISMNADQAEVAKARDSVVVDVARTFRVPPHKLMHLINVKYENMETLERSYVSDSLIPNCQRVESRLDKGLLTREERQKFFVRFDREAMVLTDIKNQAEIIKVLMDRGALTINETRKMRGRNALPGKAGDVRLIPANYNLVGPDGEVVISAGGQDGEPAEEQPGEDNAEK